MVTLSVVVFDELLDDESAVSLAQGDDVVETLATDGANEALGEGVEIWAVGRQSNKAVERVCQVASNLFEEGSVRLVGDVRNLHAA